MKKIAVLLLLLVLPLALHAEKIMQIACKINGDIVTDYQIEAIVKELMRSQDVYYLPDSEEYQKIVAQVLDNLMNDTLVFQAAQADDMKIPPPMLQEEIDKIKQGFGVDTDEALNERLKREGLTLTSLQESLERKMTVQYYLHNQLTEPVITDKDARAYFDAHADDFRRPEQVELAMILVADQGLADEIIQQAKAGTAFADLAKTHSLHEATRDSGGSLGTLTVTDMSADMREHVKDLQAGGISRPLATDDGYMILEMRERIPQGVVPFDQERKKIIELLRKKELNKKYKTFIRDLRQQAIISIEIEAMRQAFLQYGEKYEE